MNESDFLAIESLTPAMRLLIFSVPGKISEPRRSISVNWLPANISRPERALATTARSSLSRLCSRRCCAFIATSPLPFPALANENLAEPLLEHVPASPIVVVVDVVVVPA